VSVDGPVAAYRPDLGVCWLWTGTEDVYGYGVMKVEGRMVHAHVVAWRIARTQENQEIGDAPPKGLKFERFACGLALCVNPAHVRPKVAVDNLLGSKNMAAWHLGRSVCLRLYVPGGWACRACRKDVERSRRRI